MFKYLIHNGLCSYTKSDIFAICECGFLKNGGILPFFYKKKRDGNVIVLRLGQIVLFRN